MNGSIGGVSSWGGGRLKNYSPKIKKIVKYVFLQQNIKNFTTAITNICLLQLYDKAKHYVITHKRYKQFK